MSCRGPVFAEQVGELAELCVWDEHGLNLVWGRHGDPQSYACGGRHGIRNYLNR